MNIFSWNLQLLLIIVLLFLGWIDKIIIAINIIIEGWDIAIFMYEELIE